jgi:AcrR family transcriptional regulator
MDAHLLRGRATGRGVCSIEAAIKNMTARPNLLVGEILPPEPQQKRSMEKRARLKAVGLAIFGAKGYQKTSIDEIAERAGLATGGFYQHYRSKRQLLLALMDELLEKLSQLQLRTEPSSNVREGLRQVLSRSFSHDLRYLGAYRAWQEATLSDPQLAKKQKQIHGWTTGRVAAVFHQLERLPAARKGVDIQGLATTMDTFFWSLLARAGQMPKSQLNRQIDSATHLIYHAIFLDSEP